MRSEEEIQKYLAKSLPPEEMAAFEKEMAESSSLRDSVQHSRVLMRILDNDTDDFSSRVKSVVRDHRERSRQPFPYLKIAIVLLMVMLPAYLFFSLNNSTASELASEFLMPYPDILTGRTDRANIDLENYNKGDYVSAIASLKDLSVENEPVVHLYLGVSYLMIGNYEDALVVFDADGLKQSPFIHDIIWYESLALIKLERNNEARERLKRLAKESSYYKKKANELASKLK